MCGFDFEENTSLETILATEVDADTGYFLKVVVNYSDKMKQKHNYTPFCAKTENLDVSSFSL